MSGSCCGAATEWSHLDRDTVLAVAACLDSARDVAALACTCRDLRTLLLQPCANVVWGPMLARHYGLNVHVGAAGARACW